MFTNDITRTRAEAEAAALEAEIARLTWQLAKRERRAVAAIQKADNAAARWSRQNRRVEQVVAALNKLSDKLIDSRNLCSFYSRKSIDANAARDKAEAVAEATAARLAAAVAKRDARR